MSVKYNFLRPVKTVMAMDSYVEIFVPSTVNLDDKTDSAFCASMLKMVRERMSSEFGGTTVSRVEGDYMMGENLISENIAIVRSWIDGLSQENVDFILRLAETVKLLMSQDTVAISIAQPSVRNGLDIKFYLV